MARTISSVTAFALAALVVALMAQDEALAARLLAQTPSPAGLPWAQIYSGWPQPISFSDYFTSLLTCEGQYALCDYAVCLPILGTTPPIAQCGCYAFNGVSIGAGPGILNATVQAQTEAACRGLVGTAATGRCFLETNTAPFCKAMAANTIYNNIPGVNYRFDYTSTFNNSAWQAATGQNPGNPKICNGGTFTNCYSAACVKGAPNTPYMPPLTPGQPQYNATCFCPYYTTTENFGMPQPSAVCGATDPTLITASTVIYNGA